jgi:hypothetical protein
MERVHHFEVDKKWTNVDACLPVGRQVDTDIDAVNILASGRKQPALRRNTTLRMPFAPGSFVWQTQLLNLTKTQHYAKDRPVPLVR